MTTTTTAPQNGRAKAAAVGVQADVGSAPAAIAAWETMLTFFEPIENALRAQVANARAAADAMGPYSIGGELEVIEAFDQALTTLRQWRANVESYISRLHGEYDKSIEAATGKNAVAHAPMQEV